MKQIIVAVVALLHACGAVWADPGPLSDLRRQPGNRLEVSEVTPGLYRGRVPTRPEDFATLRQLGVRTVVDIRGIIPFFLGRERRRVEANGMEYLNLRLGFQPLRTGRADRILAALTEESRQPVFMHCQLDRDRMSALVAAYRVQIQGWDIATAEAEAKQFGLRPRFVGLRRFVRAGGARE